MKSSRAAFSQFLDELKLPGRDGILAGFDSYHALLLELNSRVNLFSRHAPADELWTKHFLDSLLPLKCVDFTGAKVLDFGSGGGLPGIPVKLAVPGCRMTLLDSVLKKTCALEEMVARLELADCEVVCSRLEDYSARGGFDYILCRAVKLEQRYLKPLLNLLAPGGQLLCYKAKDWADIAPLKPLELLRMELEYGSRAIFALGEEQLKTGS